MSLSNDLRSHVRKIGRQTLRGVGMKRDHKRDLNMFLDINRIDLVVDAGANVGQFSSLIRERGYKRRIWSFEPVSSTFHGLSRRAGRDPNWQVTQCALGRDAGFAEINISALSHYNSFKTVTDAGLRMDENIKVERTERVEIKRLDALLKDDPAQRIFLKIDTQGFEKEVLDGASGLLDRIYGLLLEMPADHLYENVWEFHEGVHHMWSLGFLPAQITTVNPAIGDLSSAMEFDVVFRRRGSAQAA